MGFIFYFRSRERRRSPPIRGPPAYVEAMEKWKRFKQSETVMLSSINRKRDIYDKRPEDHPAYPEEWKLFWERRYKELLEQGRDTDNHDYKTEWIPHWAKRVNAIFDEEAKQSTAELLSQFNLETAEEPLKANFEQRRDQRDRSRSRERGTKRKGQSSPTPDDRRRSRGDSYGRGERHGRDGGHFDSRSDSRGRGDSRGHRERSGDVYSAISALEEVRDRGLSPRGGSGRYLPLDEYDYDRPRHGRHDLPPPRHYGQPEWDNGNDRYMDRERDGRYGRDRRDGYEGGDGYRRDDFGDRGRGGRGDFGGNERFREDFGGGDNIRWPRPRRSISRSPRSRYDRSPPHEIYPPEEVMINEKYFISISFESFLLLYGYVTRFNAIIDGNFMQEMDDGPIQVLATLRQLIALEDLLGVLGPQINVIS